MRIFPLPLISAVLIIGSQNALAINVGDAFPSLTPTHMNNGQSNDLVVGQGKVTLVNFWATWCDSCKVELGEMEERLKPLLQNDSFQAAFVALDKEPAKAADWFKANLKNNDEMYKRLFSDADFKAADLLAVDSFPMTFIVDGEGKVRHIQRGFKSGAGQTDELAKIAEGLLKPIKAH